LKRVLLVGGFGQLGSAIRKDWTDCEIVAPSHGELALEDSARMRDWIARFHPDVLVNAAAFHDVDRCEAEPERALEINALAVGRAAALCAERDVLFVTVSTDYVFDGETDAPYPESASTHPLSLYGLSKLVGEYLARGAKRCFVVRTCGLYGAAESRSRPSFVERVLATSQRDEPLRVVADVVVSPTFAGDLAAAMRRLIEAESYGIYHAVNTGAVSWYDFAREALALAGGTAPIEPIGRAQWKAPAVRPRFSALENEKLRALGVTLPPWREGIRAYLSLR
jgi:dTDP-4-dehydrorhamnose reductase